MPHDGVDAFIARDYARVLTAYEGDESPSACCNRAMANLALESLRACMRDCDAALRVEPGCLRAYHLKGLALARMGRETAARAVWADGVDAAKEHGATDLCVLQEILSALDTSSTDTSTPVQAQRSSAKVKTASVTTSLSVDGPPEAQPQNDDDGDKALHALLQSSQVPPAVLATVRQSLSFGCGVPLLDDAIALGYLMVNTGKYQDAVDLFSTLLKRRGDLLAARLGRGSARALLGQLEEGVADFTAAIAAHPSVGDAWKRRGQTRSALGLLREALADVEQAVRLSPEDTDCYNQRGMVLQKMKDFRRALRDFKRVVEREPDNHLVWNSVGLCEANLGNVSDAIEAYDKAVALNPGFKEAMLNKAQLLRDAGDGEGALTAFEATLALDHGYVQAHYLMGLCLYGLGRVHEAHKSFSTGIFHSPTDIQCRNLAALCLHSLGRYRAALQQYDQVLELLGDQDDDVHVAWFQRECAKYWFSRLDTPWTAFNVDDHIDPLVMEGWCKGYKHQQLSSYRPLPVPNIISELSIEDEVPEQVHFLADLALSLGGWLQLNHCAGFLPNVRQHRFCGLAALEIAQTVRRHWDSLVPNATSSADRRSPEGTQPFDWRDVFNIAVRWRQLSEPNDAVWWINRLVPESFADGFGLQTPIVNGQLKVIRYYPYYQRSFELLKSLIGEQLKLGDEGRAMVHEVKDLDQLYSLVGHDFFVVSPCHSRAVPGRTMEGTRLTVVAQPPNGYEFTIRTPGTPPRWEQYSEELRVLWQQLTEAYCNEEEDIDAVVDTILSLFFYFVNFGPLSRGTASCAYTVVLGLCMAVGVRIAAPLPPGVQLDWEAILRPTPESFIDIVRPWLHPSLEPFHLEKGWPDVAEAIPTPRMALHALQHDRPSHIECDAVSSHY